MQTEVGSDAQPVLQLPAPGRVATSSAPASI